MRTNYPQTITTKNYRNKQTNKRPLKTTTPTTTEEEEENNCRAGSFRSYGFISVINQTSITTEASDKALHRGSRLKEQSRALLNNRADYRQPHAGRQSPTQPCLLKAESRTSSPPISVHPTASETRPQRQKIANQRIKALGLCSLMTACARKAGD